MAAGCRPDPYCLSLIHSPGFAGILMIDVVHLITGLGTGGAERMLTRLVTHSDSQAFRHHVVSMTDLGTFGQPLIDSGISVTPLDMPRGRASLKGFWRLVSLLRHIRPAVLNSWLYHADLLGLVAGRLTSVPAIAWNLRCADMDMTRYSTLSARLPHLLARLSAQPQLVMVNSRAGQALHQRIGYHPRRWEMIPNGFEMDKFRLDAEAPARLRHDLGLGPDAKIVGLVARFDPMKDHETFLRAAGLIARMRTDTHFVLVGTGIESANAGLAAAIAEQGLKGHVHLLGERRDIPALTAGFDIAASSSITEGFSNTIGEAMACGVPCLVTDVGDSALIVGETGRVVPPRDPRRFADAALELLALSPADRRILGQAARRRIEDSFSLPVIVARYETLYRELATAASPA